MTNKKERKITMKFNFTTFLANHSTATVATIVGLATVGIFTMASAVGTLIVDAKKKHDEKIRREGYLNGYIDSTRNFLESLDTTMKEFAESSFEDENEKKDTNENKVD